MTDIDFDELDRAVNSLINPEKPAPPAVQPEPVSAPAPVTVNEPAKPPLAERRSSGRFMDVVHPSSDMRPSTVPARSVVTRTASQPDTPKLTPPSVEPPVTTQTAQPISVPDPVPAAPVEVSSPDTIQPLESPFLSDTKVEKRPLGAFSDEAQTPPVETPVPTPEPAEPVNDLSALMTTDDLNKKPADDEPKETDTPLPAELDSDLLSIEANEDPIKPDTIVAADTAPIGPTSITQQYTEQPSTGDQPATNIFNTEAYKKPQTNKKKKSGWRVVLWVFLLLVLGTGVGAALYFFLLPQFL